MGREWTAQVGQERDGAVSQAPFDVRLCALGGGALQVVLAAI